MAKPFKPGDRVLVRRIPGARLWDGSIGVVTGKAFLEENDSTATYYSVVIDNISFICSASDLSPLIRLRIHV